MLRFKHGDGVRAVAVMLEPGTATPYVYTVRSSELVHVILRLRAPPSGGMQLCPARRVRIDSSGSEGNHIQAIRASRCLCRIGRHCARRSDADARNGGWWRLDANEQENERRSCSLCGALIGAAHPHPVPAGPRRGAPGRNDGKMSVSNTIVWYIYVMDGVVQPPAWRWDDGRDPGAQAIEVIDLIGGTLVKAWRGDQDDEPAD
ncbi:hypothetical protein [Vineibacter terrae]|uniref:hypothetical protein n=1 Tax=Vineibacter terrae TaxID=2586908 RepID=UPI002E3173D1|nr:hypothetical protein [Vineibacter terrae]HEX2888667.1 hypothetical protein [Vineibacter terrae]